MTMPNLSEMTKVCCPDCGKPLFWLVDEHDENKAVLQSCRCGQREAYNIPDGILAGFSGGPLFWYVAPGSKVS